MSSDIDPALPVQGFSARWTAPVRPTTRRIAQGSTYTRRNVPPFDRIAVTRQREYSPEEIRSVAD